MAEVIELTRLETAFDPETVGVMAAAYKDAWERLKASGSECTRPAYARAMQEVVARRIVEMAQHGIRNPQELTDKAVGFLAENYRHAAHKAPHNLQGREIGANSA